MLPKLTTKFVHLFKSVDESCLQINPMCDNAYKQGYFIGARLVCLEAKISYIFHLSE